MPTLREPARSVRVVRRDTGFSVLEIVVAIALLAVVLTAAAPQMIASIRATNTAKLQSQAKGVLQGALDTMRTLPFRVAPAAGDHRDLLDTYYRNLTGPNTTANCLTDGEFAVPQPSWSGYLAPATARCPYEPNGAAYRKVIAGGTGDLPTGFTVVLATQFVSAATTPLVLTPAPTYDTQTAGRDRPPSSQVGVTATVFYNDHGRWRDDTVYTQMASRTPNEVRIDLQAHATAVEIGTTLTTDATHSLTVGQLDLTGALSNTSQARANLVAVTGANSVTGRRDGAALTVSAPYSNLVTLNAPVGDMASGCSETCWAATAIPPFTVQADDGLPRAGVTDVGSLLNPVQTLLPDNLTRDGFQFRGSTPTLAGVQNPLVSLDATPPEDSLLTNLADGLFHCAFSVAGPTSHATTSGFTNATDELATVNPLSADACAGSRTNVVRILPTATAPDGLVRVTVRASARCTVSGVSHTPSTSTDYQAQVEYWKWSPAVLDLLGVVLIPGYGQYVSAGAVTPTTTTDPLAGVNLSGVYVDDSLRTLADYIESWAGLTVDRVATVAAGHVAEVNVPALVTVQTKPLAGDADTGVSVALGAASCRAEDNR